MKVKQLIKFLETYNPEMRVVVHGYESGYDEVTKLYQVGIEPNQKANEKYWEGEFKEVVVDDADEVALLLPRKSH
jgi:hypothetical protein